MSQGGTYPDESGCSVPVAALPKGDCNPDTAGNDLRPRVNISTELLQFSSLDQAAFTFSVSCPFASRGSSHSRTLSRVRIVMRLCTRFATQDAPLLQASYQLDIAWYEDARFYNMSVGSSSCKTPCSSDTIASQYCCDKVWRPTIMLDNASNKV